MNSLVLTVCFAAAAFMISVALAQDTSSVRLRFYQGNIESYIQSSLPDAENTIFRSTTYNRTQNTVFIIHGFTSSADQDAVKLVANAFLSRPQINVIGVDWRKLSLYSSNPLEQTLYFIQYPTAANNTQIVGKAIANLINVLIAKNLFSLDKLILVGHSLGAQTCGVIGRNLVSKPPLIIGCDAAMPLFDEEYRTFTPLTQNDAAIVHLVHTDGGVLGTAKPLGTASFFVNRGTRSQPGCGFLGIETSCSHSRSYEYVAESILNPTSFPAVKCDVKLDYIIKNCTSDYIYLGYPPNQSAKGRYYLDTNSKSKYGKGVDGLEEYKK